MTDGAGYALIFVVLLIGLVASVTLAILVNLALDKKARADKYPRQVDESETPGCPCKLEPESPEEFRTKWDIGWK